MGVERRLRMSPLLSYHMPSMRDRKVYNQTYEWSVCYDQHKYAKQCNDIKSYFSHWSALPSRSTLQGWPPGVGHDIACTAPPEKPPGYRLLLNRSTDSPDSNSKTLNNLNKRNRSLIPKSRERSHRQGGRWGDTKIRR